jgi:hypothetical protein
MWQANFPCTKKNSEREKVSLPQKTPPNKAGTRQVGRFAARFMSIFLASSFFYSQAESTPAHTQVSREEHTGQAVNR